MGCMPGASVTFIRHSRRKDWPALSNAAASATSRVSGSATTEAGAVRGASANLES
jgi:hypothetical protein